MQVIEEFCPAKVNLFLAVTGKRSDDFHEVVSLMAPLDIGDRLRVEILPGEGVVLACSDSSIPVDERNLAWRAVEAFRRCHPFSGLVRIDLEKRIPVGAGLGGGSSDAVGVLRGLNRLLGTPLEMEALHALAASIGSDCPFFVTGKPAVVRGRGDRITLLSEKVCERIRGHRLLLMKPSFSVSTAWAYAELARKPEEYCLSALAEQRLGDWIESQRPLRELLTNNLEPPVFRKYLALPILKRLLEEDAGLAGLMSGSGSTLFCLGEDREGIAAAEGIARKALGDAGWVAEATLG